MTELAPLYDWAVLDNAEQPRTIVYNVDTGQELCAWAIHIDPLVLTAEKTAAAMNKEQPQ